MGGFDVYGLTSSMTLAHSIEKAFNEGNYIFLMIMGLMVFMQICKSLPGRQSPHMQRYAPQYTAMGGAAIGGTLNYMAGGDPAQGALSGLVMGNAASGLYSTVGKGFFGFLKRTVSNIPLIPSALLIGVPLAFVAAQKLKKSPAEKRREALNDFDLAVKKAKNKDKPSTKDLEKWFSENL